ncbi:MAG: hypothetical protein RL095_505 [Verrucomicrobiota bacterium]
MTGSSEEFWHKAKKEAMERRLGKMHSLVAHHAVPFEAGGLLDVYNFPQKHGSALATLDIAAPGGKPLRSGQALEFIAFTPYRMPEMSLVDTAANRYDRTEQNLATVFTALAAHARDEPLAFGSVAEIPDPESDGSHAVMIEDGGKLDFDGSEVPLVLIVLITAQELAFARRRGNAQLREMLESAGIWPVSDPFRRSLVQANSPA